MTTQNLPLSEWTARSLRPVARWVERTDPTGTRRLVMVWAVPEPLTSSLTTEVTASR
jgi:hypothetical protein